MQNSMVVVILSVRLEITILGKFGPKNRNCEFKLKFARLIQMRRIQWCAVYIASFESCQPNRDLFGVGAKLKKSIFKNNNQINSTVRTRKWILSAEWMRTFQVQDWYPSKKMVVFPVCLNGRCCSSGCVGIALH